MADESHTGDIGRRELLRAGGGALVAGVAASAGCVGTLPLMGQRVRYGRVDTPERGDPVYRTWIPAADELVGVPQSEGSGVGHLKYVEPGETGEAELGYEFTIPAAIQLSYLEYFGVGYGKYDWVVSVEGGVVLRGDVDTDAVADALGDVYEPDGSYAGYDLYTRSDAYRRATVAASETAVVYAAEPPGAGESAAGGGDGDGDRDGHGDENGGEPAHRANAKAFVDAERGEVPRRHEVNDAFERATDAAGSSRSVWFGAPLPGPREASFDTTPTSQSLSYAFDADAGYFVFDLVFPAGATPSKSRVRSLLDEYDRALASAPTEVTVDGRVVTVEMRLPAAKLKQFGTDGRIRPPQVTWDAEYDRQARTITLLHRGGETFAANETSVRYGGADGAMADAQFFDGDDRVGPGDSLTVDLPADASEVIVYYGDRDDDGTEFVVTSFQLPGADGESADGGSDGAGGAGTDGTTVGTTVAPTDGA